MTGLASIGVTMMCIGFAFVIVLAHLIFSAFIASLFDAIDATPFIAILLLIPVGFLIWFFG